MGLPDRNGFPGLRLPVRGTSPVELHVDFPGGIVRRIQECQRSSGSRSQQEHSEHNATGQPISSRRTTAVVRSAFPRAPSLTLQGE